MSFLGIREFAKVILGVQGMKGPCERIPREEGCWLFPVEMLRTPEKGSFQHGRGLETQRVRPPGVAVGEQRKPHSTSGTKW